MKLVPEAHANSFYETFSDLIFCTLILFVLLVMALVTQVRTKVDPAITPGEFTGATGRTRLFVAFVPEGDKTGVAWVPSDIAVDTLLARNPAQDPLLELCRRFAEGREPVIIPADRFVGLGPGFSESAAGGLASLSEPGVAIALLRELRATRPGIAGNADALRQALCGEHLTLSPDTVSPDLADAYGRWQEWASALGPNRNRVHSRQTETVHPLRAATFEDDGSPRIRFRVPGPDRIVVGETELDAGGFSGMLGALDPGRGFRLECINEAGETVTPPTWVIDRILVPVGFDARAVVAGSP